MGEPQKPIAEIITNGLFTVDSKWTVNQWNKGAEELLGIEAREAVDQDLWKVLAGSTRTEFYTIYHKAFRQENPLNFKEYWERIGSWVDVIAYCFDDSLSISFKMHDQQEPDRGGKNSNQEFTALNRLYRRVAKVTNDCLWEWDLVSKEIFWIDDGHHRIFGYQVVNALMPQRFWETLLHPEDKERVLDGLKKIIDHGADCAWEEEYRLRKVDGSYAYVQSCGDVSYSEGSKACRMIGVTKDVTERKLLEDKSAREALAKQRESHNAVFTALENERASLGKELHGNIIQLLTLARLYMQMAIKHEEKREIFMKMSSGFVLDVIGEVGKLTKTLVVPGRDIAGLFDNIKGLLQDLSTAHPVKIEFKENGTCEDCLDDKLQLIIFRIVQEQLNNIVTHTQAVNALIDLHKLQDQLTLIISDDGNGCDFSKEKTGVGILSIKARAGLYNGDVVVTSQPGKGFELKVIFPVGKGQVAV